MKKGVKKGFFTILIFSFILLNFGLVRAENIRGSHIIVHALNPEGVEIASIQGMNPYSVEIYDGDTLIGYGAHNEDTHNRPISISPGTHTIKVKFNGITLSQDIALQEGESEIITFVFERTEIHTSLASLLDNQGSISFDSGIRTEQHGFAYYYIFK